MHMESGSKTSCQAATLNKSGAFIVIGHDPK
jgi:hypothetical protein